MSDAARMPFRVTTAKPLSRRAATTALALTVLSPRCARGREASQLRIGGTGMALAAMRQIANAFTATQPDMDVKVLPSLGTGGGLTAVAAGAIEFALTARALNGAERAKGLQSFAYARTPIAFVTHPDAGLTDTTLAEVADILLGRKLVWPNGIPIRLIRREPSDADWTMLRSLSAEMTEAVRVALQRPGLLTPETDQANADALERLSGAFGAMSLGQIRAEARGVIPLALNGEPPTVEAIAAGRYVLSRTLYVTWRDPPGTAADRFLTFLSSAEAHGMLDRLGHIPLAGTRP